jgi:hypothetical protein
LIFNAIINDSYILNDTDNGDAERIAPPHDRKRTLKNLARFPANPSDVCDLARTRVVSQTADEPHRQTGSMSSKFLAISTASNTEKPSTFRQRMHTN